MSGLSFKATNAVARLYDVWKPAIYAGKDPEKWQQISHLNKCFGKWNTNPNPMKRCGRNSVNQAPLPATGRKLMSVLQYHRSPSKARPMRSMLVICKRERTSQVQINL